MYGVSQKSYLYASTAEIFPVRDVVRRVLRHVCVVPCTGDIRGKAYFRRRRGRPWE